jgi:hypothetical protein
MTGVRQLIPAPVRRWAKTRLLRRAEPRNSTAFAERAEPGPLVTEVFDHIRRMPGWFNIDDCTHFYLVLRMQSLLGITGDLFEIGSYHGRSTALMCACLQDGESMIVCDAFEADTEDRYAAKPSPANLLDNIRRVSPRLDATRIVIHQCLSDDVVLDAAQRFRFAHVDGGHSAEQVGHDLALCSRHLLPGGVIVVDDYHHADWPGVTAGVDLFLSGDSGLQPLADLNRHGAAGRKLYLMRPLSADGATAAFAYHPDRR